MKKFFSILCALAIVLSASAVPAKTLGKDQKVDVKELKAQKSEFKAAKDLRTAKTVTLKQAPRETAVLRAPQAKQGEVVFLTADACSEQFYSTDNDVWVKLTIGDAYQFRFDVKVAAGTNELALNQLYGLNDMIFNYTYRIDANDAKTYFKSASLTKTIVIYEGQELVHIEAQAIDSLDNVYNITYEEAPFIITGDTIDVFFQESMNIPIYASGLCQMCTENDTMKVALTFPCEEGQPAGTYAEGDINLTYTFVNDMKAVSAHCVVTDNNGTLNLEGWILAEDGNVYHVSMHFTVPTPQSQETITCTNLAIDDYYSSFLGMVWADASNEDYTIEITFYGYEANDIVGTFSVSDLYSILIEDANENAIEIYSGSITVAVSNGSYVITGTVLATNNVEYTLNLSYVLPEPTSEETLNGAGYLYLEEADGYGNYWQAIAVNADQSRYISLLAFTEGADAGTYGTGDLYANYTYAGKFVGTDTTWYNMLDANFTLSISGDVATITGSFLGQAEENQADVTKFILNLTLQVKDERGGQGGGNQYDSQDTPFKHVFPTFTIDDQYLSQYGVLVAEATDATDNSTISLEFNMEEGATLLAPGTYPINNTYEANTVSAGTIDQYIYGSFAGYVTSQGISIPLWLLNEGTVTVYPQGVIGVTAVNTWGVAVECLLGQWPEAIENTEAAAVATKRIVNGQLVIEKNGVLYNAEGAVIK